MGSLEAESGFNQILGSNPLAHSHYLNNWQLIERIINSEILENNSWIYSEHREIIVNKKYNYLFKEPKKMLKIIMLYLLKHETFNKSMIQILNKIKPQTINKRS